MPKKTKVSKAGNNQQNTVAGKKFEYLTQKYSLIERK